MNMFTLPYGKTNIDINLPDSVDIRLLMPVPMEQFADPHGEFISALTSPMNSPSLESLARDVTGPVLIICADQTRADGKVVLISWLLDELAKYGVPLDRIEVIVAFGSHAKLSDSKIAELLNPVGDRVRITGHDVNGPMLDYGTTLMGTPVRVNAKFAEAGLVIMISSVVHHYFAGYGGGRKMLIPGLASLETISANHSLIWENQHDISGGRHPLAKSGSLDGNPIHEDLMEAVGMALGDKPNYSIVTVLSENKHFAFFAGGHIDASHLAAAKFVDKHFKVNIDQLADVVIASAGGYPKDINMIQSHKGFDNAVRALKPGGTLLYLMECTDGPGSSVMEEFAPLSLTEIRARLAGTYKVYGQTTHAIKTKTQMFRVVAVSDLDEPMLKCLGFIPSRRIDDAMRLIDEQLKIANRVYVLPRADITIPS
jgi:lactate racemase